MKSWGSRVSGLKGCGRLIRRLALGIWSLLFTVQLIGTTVAAGPLSSARAADTVLLQGFVWYDDNENGRLDAGEERAAGARIDAFESVAKVLPGFQPVMVSATANPKGQYTIALPSGRDYFVDANAHREPEPKKYSGPNYVLQPPQFLSLRSSIPSSQITLNLGLRLTHLAPQDTTDYDIPSGRFFEETGSRLAARGYGFAIVNDDNARFWDEFQRLGGVDELGYPASRRFVWDGFASQATQKEVLQWRPERGQVAFVNVFDQLSKAGKDDYLLTVRQVPKPFDNSPDTGLPWEQVVSRHLAYLDQDPAIKSRYFADPAWLDHYGLPQSYGDLPNVFVIRTQRAVFQRWKVDVPWAKAGEVTIANGGDIAKELRLVPPDAAAPEPPPAS